MYIFLLQIFYSLLPPKRMNIGWQSTSYEYKTVMSFLKNKRCHKRRRHDFFSFLEITALSVSVKLNEWELLPSVQADYMRQNLQVVVTVGQNGTVVASEVGRARQSRDGWKRRFVLEQYGPSTVDWWINWRRSNDSDHSLLDICIAQALPHSFPPAPRPRRGGHHFSGRWRRPPTHSLDRLVIG